MAQRLATKYENISFSLSPKELNRFIQSFKLAHIPYDEYVQENRDYVLILDDQGEQIILTFHYDGDVYRYHGTCTLKDRQLAELMRKAMRTYKGDAIMKRVYQSYNVEYKYNHGHVMLIREVNAEAERIIYENKDFNQILETIMTNKEVEAEIEDLYVEVDQLLDLRLKAQQTGKETTEIDTLLHDKSFQLFKLEA